MTAPTRPLRQRIKPLCRLCLRSSCRALVQWPKVCRAEVRQAELAAPQRSGLADVRAGRMLTEAEARPFVPQPIDARIAARDAAVVATSATQTYAEMARSYRLSEAQVREISDKWHAVKPTSDHLAQQQADDSTLRDLVQALQQAAAQTPHANELAVAAYVAVFGFSGVSAACSAVRSS